MNFNFKKIVFCLCSLLLFSNIYSQNFTHQQSVIDFLDRMAQKGKIEFNDLMKPVDRTTVYQLLDQLKNKTDLNEIEKKEVAFFIQLYQFDHISDSINIKPQFSYLTQNKKIQPPLFSYIDKDFRVIFNPLFEYTVNTFSKSSILASSGFQLMGYVGKKFGFQMSIRDVNETGHFDSTKLDNSAMGIIRKTTINPQQLNYSQFNASISYRINKATFTLGQGQQTIGYGKMGNIVLSDKAPSYPFFKIIYTPTRWLKFNYMHAWLQSGIVDSTKTYGLGNTVYGGKREIYVPKFFATHFVEIIPMRGLSINLGESIVYTDQLEVPYLIPISFFKAFDNNKFGDNILAGANGQIFMEIGRASCRERVSSPV